MTTAEIDNRARAVVAKQSIAGLLEMWNVTEGAAGAKLGDFEVAATLRGWIMDELEARNPEAFASWLDSTEGSPYRFYIA